MSTAERGINGVVDESQGRAILTAVARELKMQGLLNPYTAVFLKREGLGKIF